MKVVHIATMEDGGAGRAAVRLHESLLSEGIESVFLCAIAKEGGAYGVKKAGREPDGFLQKVLLSAGITNMDKVLREKGKVIKTGGHYEFYSMPFSHYALQKDKHVASADIVNFHWVSNFIDFPTFFPIRQPIVWTMHDMNPFMGGFHYKDDFLKNRQNKGLMQIETRYARIKQRALRGQKLAICAPSRWLLDESRANEGMSGFSHHHIPYGLDTRVFRTHPRAFARKVFGIDPDKKLLLFVSGNIQNVRKGFHLLTSALELVDEDIIVAAVGDNFPEGQHPRIQRLPAIRDELLLPLLYSAGDACVIPSTEDNLPNVMLESLCCGTPVLAFGTGGLKEYIKDGFNGLISHEMSISGLADIMRRSLQLPFEREAIRKDAVAQFDSPVQAKRYVALYKSLLG